MSISNSEWEIMRVVWAKKNVTSHQIFDILTPKTTWTISTVKTLLRRLVDKHYLTPQKEGKSFSYSACISEEETINRQVDALFNKFCQRKHTMIIKHLLQTTPMTMEDVETLTSLLSVKKKEVCEKIPCHCIPGQCYCKEHLTILDSKSERK